MQTNHAMQPRKKTPFLDLIGLTGTCFLQLLLTLFGFKLASSRHTCKIIRGNTHVQRTNERMKRAARISLANTYVKADE